MKSIIKNALLNAVATALYVAVAASFLFYAPKAFGEADGVLVPIAMLLLFVFSAAFTGLVMFGKPVVWYLDGNKKEATSLLVATLGIFFGIMLIVFAGLLFSLRAA